MNWILTLSLLASLSVSAQDYSEEYDDFDKDYTELDQNLQEPDLNDSLEQGHEEAYAPLIALQEASASPLNFKGKMLMTGSISVKSCVFENQQVFVIYDNCTKRESPSTNFKILSKQGGMAAFTIENSAAMEARGTISNLKRPNYDRSWRVDFKPIAAPVSNISMIDLDRLISQVGGSCTIGGMMVNSPNPNCFSEARKYADQWEQLAVPFWSEPGQSFYQFLKDMRLKVSALQ